MQAAQDLPSRPEWLRRIVESRQKELSHAFILAGNVRDVVPDGERLRGTREFLCRELSRLGWIAVAYTLSRGYRLYVGGEAYNPKNDQHVAAGKQFERVAQAPAAAAWASAAGRGRGSGSGEAASAPPEPLDALVVFERLLYTVPEHSTWRGFALVIENIEYLAPRMPHGGGSLDERTVCETLHRWGYDRLIRSSQNMVVLLTPERAAVAESLVSADSGYSVMPVPPPDEQERASFISRLRGEDAPGAETTRLARLSTGLRFADLQQIVLEAGEGEISEDVVVRRKRAVIEALCHGLLEFVDAPWSLAQSNAQPKARQYLEWVRDLWLEDHDCVFIPKALLFVGVPGNGKSHLAMAFAHDCKMSMVRLKNIRSSWVGQTERNLEAVLDVLPSLSPVVVFVDEIDQMIGARGAAGGVADRSAGGVEEHMLGRLLAFMGDNRWRGRVLWIGATNRPDLLDAAMLRRFDRVMPFMNPGKEQRKGLIGDLIEQLKLRGEQDEGEIRGLLEACNVPTEVKVRAPQEDWDIDRVADALADRTCDAIEKILRRASEISFREPASLTTRHVQAAAQDYLPNYDPVMYNFIALKSLQAVSFFSDLPWAWEQIGDPEIPEGLREVLIADEGGKVIGLDRQKLSDRLHQLSLRVRGL